VAVQTSPVSILDLPVDMAVTPTPLELADVMGAESDVPTAGDPCQRERALGLTNEGNPLLAPLSLPSTLGPVVLRGVIPEAPAWQLVGTRDQTHFLHLDGRVLNEVPPELKCLVWPAFVGHPDDIYWWLPALDTVGPGREDVRIELERAEARLREYRRGLHYINHPETE